MTFREWCYQTAKDYGNGIPRKLVHEIMTRAIRVALEEFMANPADAELDIRSIGRFYLNRRYIHVQESQFGCEEKTVIRWSVHFKPSRKLKDAINGKEDYREILIGAATPLYPEYIRNEDGSRKKGSGRKFKKEPSVAEYTFKKNIKYFEAVKDMEKQEIQNKLPEVDDEQ